MSAAQYRRFLLVLVIPLLFAGWFFVNPKLPNSAHIGCRPLPEESCVNWGSRIPEHELKLAPSWFDIQFWGDSMDEPFYIFAEGTERSFFSARIISAKSFYEDSDAIELISKIEGREANLVFQDVNIIDKKKNVISAHNEKQYLFCDTMFFLDNEDEFTAGCNGWDWGGNLTFILSDDRELQNLKNLRQSLVESVNKSKFEYRVQQILGYPIFLYLFVLLSAAIWIVIKAYRFVKHGSKQQA